MAHFPFVYNSLRGFALCALFLSAHLHAVEPPFNYSPPVVVKLPFPSGKKYLVIQGNKGSLSHSDYINRYAWDFQMAEGSEVCAVAPGTVVEVKQDSLRGGVEAYFATEANFVVIDHGLCHFSKYFHLQGGSVTVKVGDIVQTGQVIARSGHTGLTNTPHLHFCLANQWNAAIPARFSDFDYRDGLPSAGSWCTSGPAPDVAQPIPPESLLPRNTFHLRGVDLDSDLPARVYQTGTLYRFVGRADKKAKSVDLKITPRINYDPVFAQSVPVDDEGRFVLEVVWPKLPPTQTDGTGLYSYFLEARRPDRSPENLIQVFLSIRP